jgi:excisionase family DNA binding protein
MPTIYNKKNAAKVLNVSVETLDRYAKKGKLPHHKIGDRVIYTESDLIAFLDACAIPSTVLPTDREQREMQKAAGGVA